MYYNNLPNLFVVGAAKCGTSTLHEYLSEHSNIQMSNIKEPHFMLRDYIKEHNFYGPGDAEIISEYLTEIKDYKELFDSASLYKGESSPGYFSLPGISIKNINQISPESKIIISIRNPIHRTYSAYMHKVREGEEEMSFKHIIKNRIDIKREDNGWAWGWYYITDSFYYDKIRMFIENFEHVKIIFFEDLIEKPQQVLENIFEFLKLEKEDVYRDSVQKNKTGIPKNRLIYDLARKSGSYITKIVGDDFKEKIKNKLIYKPRIDEESKEYLADMFNKDILKVSDLLNYDLKAFWFNK